jgi:hypothetical protein
VFFDTRIWVALSRDANVVVEPLFDELHSAGILTFWDVIWWNVRPRVDCYDNAASLSHQVLDNPDRRASFVGANLGDARRRAVGGEYSLPSFDVGREQIVRKFILFLQSYDDSPSHVNSGHNTVCCYLFRLDIRFRRRTPGPPPFSSMNSTPADSKMRRTPKSLAAVIEVSPSALSARRIVASPRDASRARSSALQRSNPRAALIWAPVSDLDLRVDSIGI